MGPSVKALCSVPNTSMYECACVHALVTVPRMLCKSSKESTLWPEPGYAYQDTHLEGPCLRQAMSMCLKLIRAGAMRTAALENLLGAFVPDRQAVMRKGKQFTVK